MPHIPIRLWLEANHRPHALPTDRWYMELAEKLLPLLAHSPLFTHAEGRSITEAALHIALYFQDAIAQNGGWKAFSDGCRRLYGHYLPFYPTDGEDYQPDEINPEDIAFLLWKCLSRPGAPHHEEAFTLADPFAPSLLSLSRQLYDLLDECFEEAPICESSSAESWLLPPALLAKPIVALPDAATLGPTVSPLASRCLTYNQGKPLLYFADYAALCIFFVQVLGWENKPSALLPELAGRKEFIIYANAKGMLIAPDTAAYFRTADNPLFDAGRAAKEGYRMFCIAGACPFDLLKYGMAKGLLPDVALPFPQGKETLHRHWDFLARYYLGEYYEGE